MNFLGLEFCRIEHCFELYESGFSVRLEVDQFFEVNEDPVVVESVSIGNDGVGEVGLGINL